MHGNKDLMLLVGDNPFHGISHLSQERGRVRGDSVTSPEYAAKLVMIAVENGASGFMFSVSENTLSILKVIRQAGEIGKLKLYALVPYAYEYVRLANRLGGISGLAKRVAKQVALSGNVKAVVSGLKGVITRNPVTLMETYLMYEISRIRSAAGRDARLDSVLLHEVITDMSLAFELDWLFESYVKFMLRQGIRPGFETRNFAYLVHKFKGWGLDLSKLAIASPFNKIGFQMNPSQIECEEALLSLQEPSVIAMSILAAGYLKPSQAISYVRDLPNLRCAVVGVSSERHASETFKLFGEKLET
ncbi:hypothetical protein MUP01_11195 [Candidatus Bathyarchaeota archaeon]|nr:hypothetical protein [Candidatus Bathyarchaeota archaeon]